MSTTNEPRSLLAVCAAMRWEAAPVLRALGATERVRHEESTVWISRRLPVIVFRTGLGQDSAAAATSRILKRFPSVRAVLNTGCAGALVPGLAPGALVIPAEVYDASRPDLPPFTASSGWVRLLRRAASMPADGGPLHSSPMPLASEVAKRAAHALRGATAVEMEAASVAAVAKAHGIQFAAIRSILDDLSAKMPNLATGANTDGLIARFKLHLGSVAHVADLTPFLTLPSGVRAVRTALHEVFRTLFEGRPVIEDWFEIDR